MEAISCIHKLREHHVVVTREPHNIFVVSKFWNLYTMAISSTCNVRTHHVIVKMDPLNKVLI